MNSRRKHPPAIAGAKAGFSTATQEGQKPWRSRALAECGLLGARVE
jgi:hypothetical protein